MPWFFRAFPIDCESLAANPMGYNTDYATRALARRRVLRRHRIEEFINEALGRSPGRRSGLLGDLPTFAEQFGVVITPVRDGGMKAFEVDG
ncbi:MAG: hypothetical protein JWN47_2423 [Frankiales bacterium]|nr:hypothetical protein [Frankiales bacterium]